MNKNLSGATQPAPGSSRLPATGAEPAAPRTALYGLLCRAVSGQAVEADWAELGEQDWKALVKMADAEGVAPLLHWRLSRLNGGAKPPDDVRKFLMKAFYNSAARFAVHQREFSRLAERLCREGVEVVALKGLALAQTLYPEPGLRPMGDIDLLVHRDALGTVKKIMPELGYALEKPDLWPGLGIRTDYEINYDLVKPGRIHMEIHWDLVGSAASTNTCDIEWFWSQCVAYPGLKEDAHAGSTAADELAKRCDGRLWVLNPTGQLLHLAAHLMLKHSRGKTRLIWFYDLAMLLDKEENGIVWDLAVEKAIEWGWGEALAYALMQVREQLGAPVPEAVLGRLAEERNGGQLHPDEMVEAGVEGRFWAQWQYLLSLKPRYRLQVLVAMVFPGREYMRWRYHPAHDWLLPVYYLYRWWDRGREAARTAIVRAKKKILANFMAKGKKY